LCERKKERNHVYETAKAYTKAYAKQAVKRGAIVAGKKTAMLAGKALAAAAGYLLALVGLPAAVILLVAILVSALIAAFYGAMPGGATLLGANPDPRDVEVREYAEERVAEWNAQETWLVDGEGSWYPGAGKKRFGRLMDRYGQDAKTANQWGDIYAPVLFLAAQSGGDKMQNRAWLEARLEDAAKKLRPWYYYKESYVKYCDKDGCSREIVYLLVESYTIRGHYQYRYRWVTKHYEDGSSVTYEEPAGRERLAGGLENYLRPYLVRLYGIPDGEQAQTAAQAVFEAGMAFSAQAENMAWLMDRVSLLAAISGASIPAEFRSYLEEAEKLTGIPVWFLAAVIEKESSWNLSAVNEDTGCFGLTQLHPDYWPEWATRWGFDPEADRWNPRAQIIVGAYVLAGYGAGSVDWEDLDLTAPPKPLLAALARYGGYGENVGGARGYIDDILRLAEAYRSRPAAWPVPGHYIISSHYGWRIHPVFRTRKFHDGIDIPAPTGAAVVSVSGGVVAYAGFVDGYGLAVIVRDARYEYLYAHLSRVDVREGEAARPGARLGAVGSTGVSTGPHLHFGVRPVGAAEWIDPEPILQNLI